MLEILDAGLFTTLQDLGRNGYQEYGVTRGGAMDPLALRAANQLVGNPWEAAALEISAPEFRARALEKCVIAIAGAGYTARINERSVPNNASLFLRAGDTLSLEQPARGRYGYLALGGGLDVPVVLGSRATDLRGGFGGLAGRALRAGDVLRARNLPAAANPVERAGKLLPAWFVRYYADDSPIRVLWGPHREFFGAEPESALTVSPYFISEVSDRMGTRLYGAPLARKGGEILSCGVTRGAIQAPPDGQPIVLQADHQTTGGYPIVATVIRADIPRLAQKRPGDVIRFVGTNPADADAAYRALAAMNFG